MIRAVLIALLAAACSPSAPERNSAEPPAVGPSAPEPSAPTAAPAAPAPPILPADATPVTDIGAISGEWRVGGVAGQALSQPFGISASIGDGRVRFVSQCVARQYALQIEGGLVAAKLLKSDEPDCARPLTLDERGLEQAMAQAKTVYRLPSNALVFDGPAGAVTLFTQ